MTFLMASSIAADLRGFMDWKIGAVVDDANRRPGGRSGISMDCSTWAALQLAKRPENKGEARVAIVPSSPER